MIINDPQIETKKKIKDAFIAILMGKINLPLSMRSIEEITNLSPGTIYYHYKNKAFIVLEAVKDFWTDCLNDINLIDYPEDIVLALKQLYEVIYPNFKIFQKY